MRPSRRAPWPATRQHIQHIRHLLTFPYFTEMAAMVVDDDSRAERILQPREFTFIENQVIAVGLRIVVAVGAQNIRDDVESIGGNQGRAGRVGTVPEVGGSND